MNYWKMIAIVVALLATVGYVKSWYDDQIEAAFNRGSEAVKTEYEEKVKKTNEDNRAFEERMGTIINDYGASFGTSTVQRSGKELKQLNEIKRLIQQDMKYHSCEVDQSVTDARNKVRDLGPGDK
jgi:hypothetical protein